jgi:uncharacterized iron-regulated protein
MILKKSQYIIKTGSAVLSILLIIFLWNDTSSKDMVKFGHNSLVDPSSYVLEKLKISDVVLLGTKHRQKSILDFISGILPRLHEADVSHLGLEIASDQQPYIDHYMESGIGINNIKLHHTIDCPEYRDLLTSIRKSGQKNVLKPIALDLPPSLYESRWNRDEYMAMSICNILDSNPDAKLLVVVGNLHALKNITWDDNVPNKYGVIRSYLSEYKPGLKVFSICQCINDVPKQNALSNNFTMNIIKVAFDCTDRFSNYKMDILETVAAKHMNPYEIADGVVMYWN